jgi:hypothetical protein
MRERVGGAVSLTRAPQAVVMALLLGGWVVLAFFAGGYFPVPRMIAALLACLALALLAAAAPLRVPRAGWVAAGGLFALAGWTALSIGWAPLSGPAIADVQRLVLYAAAFAAGLLALRERLDLAAPAVAAGCVVVVGAGLLSRTLPWLVALEPEQVALGRLDQPLTYWNGMGLVAALGIVLCAGLAAEPARTGPVRRLAAAGGVALVPGLLLTFSRGALGAAAAALVVLVLLAPTRGHLRSTAAVAVLGAVASIPALVFDGVRDHADGGRAGEGALALVWIALLMAAAAWLAGEPDPRRLHRGLRVAMGAVAAVGVVVLIVAAAGGEDRAQPAAAGATAQRLTTIQSTRWDYWRVAVRMVERAPLRGEGASAFRAAWLQERPYLDGANDAHSLYLETLAELGVVGLALLALVFTGVGAGTRAAWRAEPLAAAGPAAALVAYALHAGLDWHWELPAVTLPALVLAAALSAAHAPRAA